MNRFDFASEPHGDASVITAVVEMKHVKMHKRLQVGRTVVHK